MKLAEVSIKRPVFATMMISALLVLGAFSWSELPVEMFPNVDFPVTVVQTVYKGASAEAVETDVTKKIEDAVNEISGVKHIQSQSYEGYSQIIIQFELEKKGFEATQQVREKVAGIRADLPEDIEEPVISQHDPSAQPIISLSVSGERSPRDITEIVKNKIKKRLEAISGVGAVRLIGGSEREILIALNPERMEAYGVAVDGVLGRVAAANLEIPGGRVDEHTREYLVRVKGRVASPSWFNDVIVKTKNGVPIYLSDIGRVVDTVAERRSLARYNGKPSVALDIVKQSGGNEVEIAERVRHAIAELQKELPPDIEMEIVNDNSTFIRDSIHEILFNIRLGTLLAVIVIFLFLLDYRPTVIAGLSIPISIIGTFTAMRMFGFTINFMTLMGLSLAVGILVDDAIVVMENIFRHRAEGKSPMQAAFDGTKEIGLAVMATTFTVVAVFVPVAFMEGIVGRFFLQFGLTVAFSVLISLFVAFSLTPMLSSRWLHGAIAGLTEDGNSTATVSRGGLFGRLFLVLSYWNRFFDRLKPGYRWLLAASLKHRGRVIAIATLSFVAAIGLSFFVGNEFIAQSDRGQLMVTVETPAGTDLDVTSERIAQVEEKLRALREVKGLYVTIGAGQDPVTKGHVLVNLTDKSQRRLSAKMLMDSVRTLVTTIPGIKVAVGPKQQEGGAEKAIEISLRGDDLDELKRLTHEVEDIMKATPGVVDVDNTLEEGKPELQIETDRKAANDLGVSLAEIPRTIRALVEGDVVTRYKEGDEEYDVRVRLDKKFRQSTAQIGRILVVSDKELPSGGKLLVPVKRIAKLHKATSIGRYNRYDRRREVRVNANVTADAFSGSAIAEIMKKVSGLSMPPGYQAGPVGQEEMRQESFQNIFKALFLSVIFIYLALASQYESFFDPLSIMISLPLSLVGAIIGLLGSSFSIMSLIGIVLLMGL
ncbi:MAG: efflux RND transporter permease subunit, partial [Candidatus Zixiibacteriota bacterium]